MLFFTIRRVLTSAVVLLVASVLVFAASTSIFDPLTALRMRQPPPAPETFAAERHALGLDKPVYQQYLDWLGGILHGDFGKNKAHNPINDELFTRLGVTLRMIAAALIFAVLLAIIVGVVTAVRQYKFSDYFFTVITYLLIALPTFWFAALLKEAVAVPINHAAGHRIFFTSGSETPRFARDHSGWEVFSDQFSHLILPTVSLAALSFAGWSRYQRATMLDVLGSDYMRLARAKGLPWPRVLIRHGLRNALIPTATAVALGVGALLGGAVVTEQIFNWHGMGEYLFENGLAQNDSKVVMAWLILSATFIVLANLVADLLYAVLDPRIRLS